MRWMLAILAIVSVAPAVRAEPVRVLLAVAAHKGASGEARLQYSAEDARRVRDVLVTLGGVRPENAILLVDPSSAKLRQGFERARELTLAQGKDNVTFFFYFSGHGDRERLHLGDEPLSIPALARAIDSVPAALRIVITDACRTEALRAKGVNGEPAFPIRVVPAVVPRRQIVSIRGGPGNALRRGTANFQHGRWRLAFDSIVSTFRDRSAHQNGIGTPAMRSSGVIALLVLAMGACGEGAATQTKGSENGGSFSGTSGGPPSTGGAAGSSGAVGSGGSAALGSGGASGTAGSGGSLLSDGSVGSGATGGVGGALGVGGAGGTGATTQCSSTSTLAPGETTRTIQVGGLSRTYILHVPSSYTGTSPVPLVLDFHPLFGTGAIERSNSGYLALSEQYGFVIAYPDGIDNAWNIGPCCTMSRTVDDLGFARAMVEEISAQGCIDRTRVYATGYSMGGGMSYYLACNAADLFAAVAPSAFDLLIDSEEPCHPVRPITVISFRGTADPIVPYSGGASNPPNGLPVTIHFLGAVATFQKWSDLDACTDTPSTQGDCQTHSACAQGVEVTLCTAVGGGHVTGDPNIGWQTLSRHALP